MDPRFDQGDDHLLELARDAATRSGAAGLLLMPEGAMDWAAVRALTDSLRVLVAVETDRQEEAVPPPA